MIYDLTILPALPALSAEHTWTGISERDRVIREGRDVVLALCGEGLQGRHDERIE